MRTPRRALSKTSPGSSGGRGMAAVVLVLLLTLAACAGDDADGSADETPQGADENSGETETETETEPAGEQKTSVTVAWTADVTSLDYGKGSGAQDWRTLEHVYDNLTIRTREGEAAPAIAESWDFNEDATELTVHVREGVRFHDGEPLTAADVAYSLERLIDPDFPGQAVASAHDHVESVEVIDDFMVLVSFSRPDPFWIHNSPAFTPIVPAGVGEDLGYEEFGSTPETAIGTGPYKVVAWERDSRLVLEAFDDYWRGAPAIKDVVIRPIPENAARTAALLSGEVDLSAELPSEQIARVEEDENLDVRSVTSVGRYFFQVNAHARQANTPLDNRDVREAIAWAVDLQLIIDTILDGRAELTSTLVLPFEVGFNESLEPYGFDPDRARDALERAGYADGIEGLEFLVRTRDPAHAEVGTAIQAMLADVGIDVELTILEDADFAQRHADDDLDLSFWVFSGAGTFHAGLVLPYIHACDDGSANWSRKYCNEEVRRLLIEEGPALQATDEEAATEVWLDVQEILHEDYATPGAFGLERSYGVAAGLDWEPHPYDSYWLYEASWN